MPFKYIVYILYDCIRKEWIEGGHWSVNVTHKYHSAEDIRSADNFLWWKTKSEMIKPKCLILPINKHFPKHWCVRTGVIIWNWALRTIFCTSVNFCQVFLKNMDVIANKNSQWLRNWNTIKYSGTWSLLKSLNAGEQQGLAHLFGLIKVRSLAEWYLISEFTCVTSGQKKWKW